MKSNTIIVIRVKVIARAKRVIINSNNSYNKNKLKYNNKISKINAIKQ